MIKYQRAHSDKQLHQILEIQRRALKQNITLDEQKTEGYITVPHTFEILKKMNVACPHVIAVEEDRIVGYALVMLESFRNEMEVLVPMFETADRLLPNKNYLTMGQICIDKPYRGKGVFKGLYAFYKKELASQYDCLFTEVATLNTRSMNAHLAVGFEILATQETDGTSWEMVNWEWNK